MLKIRLMRIGAKKRPFYRVVAIDEHKKRNGKAIEILGSYNPHAKVNKMIVKLERIKYWLSVGAKPSATVENLLKNKS